MQSHVQIPTGSGSKKSLEDVINNFSLEDSMVFIDQIIPCILHMENRIGEKILKLLRSDGSNERDGDKKAIARMIANVNKTMNTKILCT